MNDAPVWFTDLFLDFLASLNKNSNKERFLSYGCAVFTTSDRHHNLTGYALLTDNLKDYFFIGRCVKTNPDTGEVINVNYEKQTLCLTQIE